MTRRAAAAAEKLLGTSIVLLAASLAAPFGCAQHAGAPIERGMETMSREQTADKLLERGKAFAQVGDLTRAEQYLSAALDAGGDANVVLPLLMHVCIEAQKLRVAIDYGERHLRSHPSDGRLRFLVGTLYAAIGDMTTARARLEEAVRAVPDDAEAHFALAVVLREGDDDVTMADYHFREYLRLSPKGPHAEEARASLLKSVP